MSRYGPLVHQQATETLRHGEVEVLNLNGL
jgi:hypothetical protein